MFIQYRRCHDSLTRRIMKNSLLIEVFSRDLFNFTRGVTEHFSTVPVKGREKKTLSCCLDNDNTLPLPFFIGVFMTSFIYPMYNKQTEHGKLLIALFSPLFGVIFKVILRLCTQRLKKITHPGYSYIVPLYLGSAFMFRVMQAELGSLKFIAVLGVIQGAVEVIEAKHHKLHCSYLSYALEKKISSLGKSTHSLPRETNADITILGMLYESTAIVSVNGVLYLNQINKGVSF